MGKTEPRWEASDASLSGAAVSAAKALAQEALVKAQRAAAKQKTITLQMSNLVGMPLQLAPFAPKVPTMSLDEQGRLVDERGKVIQRTTGPQSTIMANQNTARTNPLLQAEIPETTTSRYFDPRMASPGQLREQRKKRTFNFVAQGHFSKKADDLRAKAAVEQMIREAKSKPPKPITAKDASASEQSSALQRTPTFSVGTLKSRLAEVPAVEWWDQPLLRANLYVSAPGEPVQTTLLVEAVTHYVEHPIPVEPPAEPLPPPPQPLPLTKKERKKLRTQRRLAAEKEKQDQIRCGLLPPPPPKVKISNLMQAMKNEAVADPSAIEAKVRAEMAQRIKNHEERNQARKLTPEQRKEKKRRKLMNDRTAGGTPVTIYRVDEMPNKQKLYKIDINAQQNHLTGVALLVEGCNVVVVEGGPKAQKRYRKLLMDRIDWTETTADNSDDDEEEDRDAKRRASADVCKLVWEGSVVKAHFKNFRIEAARTPEAARKLLKERGCEHYWDMAVRFGQEGIIDDVDGEEQNDDEGSEDSDVGESA
jgi:U4/U6 small nuclear ribonucleoprotein PRP3